jgi:hypothetical protein
MFSAGNHYSRTQVLKRLQTALTDRERTNAKLQQATKAKTDFLANMSHGYSPLPHLIPSRCGPCIAPSVEISRYPQIQTHRAAYADARNHRDEQRAAGHAAAQHQGQPRGRHHFWYSPYLVLLFPDEG